MRRHGPRCNHERQVAMRLRWKNFSLRRLARLILCSLLLLAAVLLRSTAAVAQQQRDDLCPRPQPGSVVAEPEDLRSRNGVLETELIARNQKESDGRIRYCFTDAAGRQSPNPRVHPGDLVILHLQNRMTDLDGVSSASCHALSMTGSPDACTASLEMSPIATNLHFHGLTIPPVCHQDDVLKTAVEPG